MSETTVVIKEVKTLKSGTNSKGPWNLYGVLDGNDEIVASTFDSKLIDEARQFEGQKALVEFEEDEKGKKLKSVKPAPAESTNGTPALGTGEYVKGQTSPADKESINRAVALKAAVALATHTIPSSATPSQMVNTKVGPLCQVFEVYLRTGSWPGNLKDEDIPF